MPEQRTISSLLSLHEEVSVQQWYERQAHFVTCITNSFLEGSECAW